ncbi:MAG: J domain-containing protein [Alphaproteobacteria bacterium]|nr:J domain-containing protein [Alphaproteobacteria bacterium]
MDANTTDEILGLKWAYHVVGVDHNATATTIKQRYRALVKEWHPDKWASSPDQEAHATRRMQNINSAYDQIKDAPLRYHISTHPRAQERWKKCAQETAVERAEQERVRQGVIERARKRRLVEFWFRFLFGMVFSIIPLGFIYLKMGWVMAGDDRWFLAACIILPLICGWANARYKDNFWSGVGEIFYSYWWFR